MSFQAMRRALIRAAEVSVRGGPPVGTVATGRGRWTAARIHEVERSYASPFARSARRRVHTDDPYTPAHRAKAVAMAGPLGLVAGMFGSVVGVGGGVLIVPAITSAVPIPQRVVTGTSLIAVLSTAGVATYNFSHAGLVDPTAAAILGGSAMLSAPFGARLTTRLDCVQLRRILAYFLLCAAPLVPLKAAVFHYRATGQTAATAKKAAGRTWTVTGRTAAAAGFDPATSRRAKKTRRRLRRRRLFKNLTPSKPRRSSPPSA